MVILPALSTSTRAIPTPAAATALTALVTSCCRNVEGARHITLLHQQIERACERARARAVAVADDGLAQGVSTGQRCCSSGGGRDRRGTGVHIKGRPVLCDVPEYFSNPAVGEATNPGRIS